MRRRDLILGTLAGLGLPWCPSVLARPARADGNSPRWRSALKHFPYELVETPGAEALATWERLKREGRDIPVVVGSARDVAILTDRIESHKQTGIPAGSADEIIAGAAQLRHPQDFWAMRKKADVPAGTLTAALRERGRIRCRQGGRLGAAGQTGDTAKVGSREYFVDCNGRDILQIDGILLQTASDPAGLTVAVDYETDAPLDAVFIAIIPANDPNAVAAHFRYGGWNDNPYPEYHVAALRSWHERYGAEIVGMTDDVMNVRVRNRPRTCDEAITLAREQNEYCGDVLGDDLDDLLILAAMLMENDWWYFWWE